MTLNNVDSEVIIDGRRLKAMRVARNWSQTHLSNKSGVGQGHISKIERGHRTNVELTTLKRLASALGVRPADFLEGSRAGEDLPDFRTYVMRKFARNPRLQKALIAAYDLLQSPSENGAPEEYRRAV